MPLLTISLRGSELQDKTMIKLERGYKFSKLTLQHIYHNIDSKNFKIAANKENAVQLYIKLGGLVDNHKSIINYIGNFNSSVAHVVPGNYNSNDYVLGGSTQVNNPNSVSQERSTTRIEPDILINHIIPIGASKCGGTDYISRDLFKKLETHGVLNFNGQINFELHFMDFAGAIEPITATTGGIQGNPGIGKPISQMTLVFEYEEVPDM